VHGIVHVPDEPDIVRFAGMEGVPVHMVSSSLRDAYRVLTERLATAPARTRA